MKKVSFLLPLSTLLFIGLLLTGCLGADSPLEPGSPEIQATEISAPPSPTPLSASPTSPSPATPAPPEAEQSPASATRSAVTSTPLEVGLVDPQTPRPTLEPEAWKSLPVLPTLDERLVAIYQYGLKLGNNPHAFSKIGDCGSTPAWFLGDFDRGPGFYRLGEYEYLSEIIQYYQGSFDRTSMAARSGFNVSSLLVTLWTDISQCKITETPLACEVRLHRPALAFVMLGTNDIWHPQEFEPQMRTLITYLLNQGIIPILSTKADNQEGDGSINRTIARLANEYGIPLWNYWLAVQALPDQGLQEDGAHLTWARNFFDDPEAMAKAWPVRNLTALQVLDNLWRYLNTLLSPP